MVFSSAVFLFIFLPAVLLLYFLPVCFWNRRLEDHRRNLVLCAASLIFYAWGEPVYIILMLLSIGFNFNVGLDIERCSDDPKTKKRILIAAVVFDLMLLGFFKYSNFLIGNVNGLFSADIPLIKISLPVGISFYTFQILSYVVDVYRGQVKAQHNIVSFAMYISMFPQLIAGPIVQYSDIEKQLFGRRHTPEKFLDGIFVFIRGLGKKVIFANAIGAAHTEILSGGTEGLSAATAWLAAICYTMQIYFDFGGYSDMAIGLGRMFGFEFMQNFNFPYTATSIKDFWKRWHISLSGWFRDYVYIPLGGSRCSRGRLALNLFIVWSLTGFWHGANWTFLVWGLIYFLLLILEKFTSFTDHIGIFGHLYTLLAVITAWVIFQFPDLGQSLSYLSMMWGQAGNPLFDERAVHFLSNGWLIWLMGLAFSLPLYPWLATHWRCWHSVAEPCLATILFLLSLIATVAGNYNPFIYFNF